MSQILEMGFDFLYFKIKMMLANKLIGDGLLYCIITFCRLVIVMLNC